MIKRYPAKAPAIDFDPATDAAVFQFTGGTTGLPKAAELTHRNLVANTTQLIAWMPSLDARQRETADGDPRLPCLRHDRGHALLTFALGGELVVVPNPRDTLHNMEVLQREKITLYPGVPTMYIAIINHPKVAELTTCVRSRLA